MAQHCNYKQYSRKKRFHNLHLEWPHFRISSPKSNAACTGYTTYDVSTLGPFLETTEHISGAIEYFANTHTISSFSKCKLVQNVSYYYKHFDYFVQRDNDDGKFFFFQI